MSNKDVVKGLRILVLEDEQDTRDLLQFLLESHGATVMVADNVPEGLEIFAKSRPDIVVADIGMPEYNGYAFIAAVRKQQRPELRNVPVIALTAFSTPADRDTALISGFNEYLSKPFGPEELLRTIRRLHDEHRIDTAA
ncbi:MAG TPA: response regulator [Terriglobia bacterium]|nr:response regulator [Terriglobia bacterium]